MDGKSEEETARLKRQLADILQRGGQTRTTQTPGSPTPVETPNRNERRRIEREAQQEEIERALRLFHAPGEVFEIRILKARVNGRALTVAGYFDDVNLAVAGALKYDGNAEGVYQTANVIHRGLLARAPNQLVPGLEPTTADRDVIRRKFILLDFDPKRPRGISSNAAELEQARVVARSAYQWLKEQGLPHCSVAASGNGYHVVVPVDLPNDAESTQLVKRFLEAIAARFNTDAVEIDTAVHNASRIIKLWGTTAAKGTSTAERPHRLTKLVHVSDAIEPAAREQLEKIVSEHQQPPINGTTGDSDAVQRVRQRLMEHGASLGADGYKISREAPFEGGTMFILSHCCFNPEHVGTSAAAFAWPEGKVGFNCKHEGCSDKHGRDLKRLLGLEEPCPKASVTIKQEADQASSKYNWPDELAPEAYHGLTGEVAKLIDPNTEADPAAIISQFLVGFGSIVGRRAHFAVEATKHFPNLYAVIVGQTAKARKGTSWDQVRRVLAEIDSQWARERVTGGLASGEGVIWAIRDPLHERNAVKEKGRIIAYEEAETDPGIADKRLLIFEPEFARVLQVAERDTNTLTSILRDAWDGRDVLSTLTRKLAARATGAHLSVIAHITRDELRRLLTDTAKVSGFANRFLWICARRSKLLPEGGSTPEEVNWEPIFKRLREVAEYARYKIIDPMRRSPAARAIWREVYEDLSEGKPGMFGATTSRGDAQVVRLSMLYALIDCSPIIDSQHLQAALALWRYVEDSAKFIFGDSLGDPTADEILQALRSRPQGMTRTEIREHFGRNKLSEEIARALGRLQEYGLARMTKDREQEDQKRPTERWRAITLRG